MTLHGSTRRRFLLAAIGLPVLALVGSAAAVVSIPNADAGLVPTETLPTVSVPGVPVPSLPVPTLPSLPTGTTDTTPATTTPATSTPAGGAGAVTTVTTVVAGQGATNAPPGSGQVAAEDATAPVSARVAIARITVSPRWIRARGQQVRLSVRVTDGLGHRVRGAAVDIRSTPAWMIKPLGVRKTAGNGIAGLALRTTARIPLRTGSRLTLVVRVYRAGAVHTPANAVRRIVVVPIRSR